MHRAIVERPQPLPDRLVAGDPLGERDAPRVHDHRGREISVARAVRLDRQVGLRTVGAVVENPLHQLTRRMSDRVRVDRVARRLLERVAVRSGEHHPALGVVAAR